ncbi:MAG TPA: hypothetical protein ENK91_01345 [Bacteroidetes bacterium]|nr:hypothetical protein [Bacteroidota bacterium]
MKKIIIFAIMILMATTEMISQQLNDTDDISNCPTIPVITIKKNIVLAPPMPPNPPTDTDGDGIPDFVEGTDDCDGDGIPNFKDLDSDNDGLSDEFETWSDLDEDGIMNICDLDSDGDGIPDSEDKCYDKKGTAPSGCPTTDGDRHVFWVHGYTGTAGAWRNVGHYSENTYQIQSDFIDYSNNQSSLEDEAGEIESDILNEVGYNNNNQNNFIIAHSGGSIASRVLGQAKDYSGNNAFNGFITFGGPHLGAAAADFLETPGNKERVIKEICTDLGEGPGLELAGITPGIGWLTGLPYTIFEALGVDWADLCAVMPVFADPFINNMLYGVEPQLTTDYVQNNVEPMQTQHNAAFYGIETDTDEDGDDIDETLTPRFIGNLTNDANGYSLWGAGQADQDGIDLVNDVVTLYNNHEDFWYYSWLFCSIRISPLFCTSKYNKYKAFKKGVKFLKKINPYWKTIIGAEDIDIEQVGCACVRIDPYDGWEDWDIDYSITDCDQMDDTYCDYVVPVYERTSVHKPSDGFILAESAMNAPGANYQPQEMPGSGHIQMRNDENTKIATQLIFDEGLNGGFFNTDRR